MSSLYGRTWTKHDLLERVGDISQIGGARPVRLVDGPEDGVAAALVRTGSGFAFTVLPGRGMDVGFAEYRGVPLCWRSSTGEVNASFYDSHDQEWLRGFYGGLMVTCGLTTAGWPTIDEEQALGLHGRASYLSARNVHIDGEWDGDEYVMWVQGKVRETIVYGENVQLTRRVWARLGESRLFIDDVVENLGHTTAPHMIAYHVNAGFPIVDAGAELISSAAEVMPVNEESSPDIAGHARFEAPQPGWTPQVYYHRLGQDERGIAYTAVVNRHFSAGGLGLYVKHRTAELPWLWQWKQIGQGTYVVGIEPANCQGEGRAIERLRGTLRHLEPGERRAYHLEIGVLDGAEAIDDFARAAAAAREGEPLV